MNRTIVVGTDGSPSSMTAVKEAAALAVCTHARLQVACVVRVGHELAALSPMGLSMAAGYDDRACADASTSVERATEVARRAGAQVEGRVLTGEPAGCLMALAEELGADLLVVGSRGMTGPARFLLGSVPNRCAHHAPCSVLIVRTG
jgi:nucleotide-binding universal stress UspA family protein